MSSHQRNGAAILIIDLVWLYCSPFPIGRRRVFYLFYLPSRRLEEEGRGSAPCSTKTQPYQLGAKGGRGQRRRGGGGRFVDPYFLIRRLMTCEQNLPHKRKKSTYRQGLWRNLVIIYFAIEAIISFAVRAILFFLLREP